MRLKNLKDMDVAGMLRAAEKDAGHRIPGLRAALQDAKAGRYAAAPAPRKHQGAYERRQIEAGAARIPGGLLSPEAAQALGVLLAAGAPSKVAAINQALVTAAHAQARKAVRRAG